MSKEKETPERLRERLRQEELKRSPGGNLNDSLNRASTGGLVDLVGSLGWRFTGILIVLIIVVYVIASYLMD
ncbi:MAG: DUF6366 family protein [Bacillota bacterium]